MALVWRQTFRSAWKDFSIKFDGILSKLEQHKMFLQDLAAAVTFENYQQDRVEIFQHLHQYEKDRQIRIFEIKRKDQEERDKRTAAVKEWLAAAPSNEEDHQMFCNRWKTSKARGSWILRHEKVVNWREAETPRSSLLWLNGIPGAGMSS